MIKKITISLSVCILIASCGPALVNTLMEVNTGEAKRFGKLVITKNVNKADLLDTRASTNLREFILSTEGKAYFLPIRNEYGELKKLKLKGVKGSNSDTMNYRFVASFRNSDVEQEVRVQTFQDHEIISVLTGSWEDEMKPLEK